MQFENREVLKTYHALVYGHPLWEDLHVDLKLEPIYNELEELRKYIREVGQVEKNHMDLIISSYRFRLI